MVDICPTFSQGKTGWLVIVGKTSLSVKQFMSSGLIQISEQRYGMAYGWITSLWCCSTVWGDEVTPTIPWVSGTMLWWHQDAGAPCSWWHTRHNVATEDEIHGIHRRQHQRQRPLHAAAAQGPWRPICALAKRSTLHKECPFGQLGPGRGFTVGIHSVYKGHS